jgi:AP-2 complex subunit alpha
VVLGALVNEKSELNRLINQALLSDLTHRRETFQTLSLTYIANCGNAETAETLANNVAKILMNKAATTYLLKKSSLCLVHLFRKNAEAVQTESWLDRLKTLLNHRDGGVLTCVMSLLHAFASANPTEYEPLVPVVTQLIKHVVLEKGISGDYMYDHIPAPWLIVKAFQFFQLYSAMPTQECLRDIGAVLQRIINTENKAFIRVDPKTRALSRKNAMLAVLFEAINVTVKLHLPLSMVQRCIHHVRAFMHISDPDTRYLSLEAIQRLCPLDPTTTGNDPEFVASVERNLRSPDISIRRRALDVLFELCSEKNSKVIVAKLLDYLDVCELELQEELVCFLIL